MRELLDEHLRRPVLFATIALGVAACASEPEPGPGPPPNRPPLGPCDNNQCEPIPDDLQFSGAERTLAAGGEISIIPQLCSGRSCTRFDASFEAVGDDVVEVVRLDEGGITVRALSSGLGLVRLIRPEDGAVFGEATLEARDAATILEDDVVYAAEAEHTIEYQLRDKNGDELHDDRLSFDFGSVDGQVVDDESFRIGPSAPESLDITVRAADGREAVAFTVDIVSAPDEAQLVKATLFLQDEIEIDPPIAELGTITTWFFQAFYRDRLFVGAPWTAVAPDDLEPNLAVMLTSISGREGALLFNAQALGQYSFTVLSGGVETDFVLDVVDPIGQ